MAWASRPTPRTGTAAHRRWKRAVLERAEYRCELRGPRCAGRAAEADHRLNVARFPELEFDVSNGQAACAPCHRDKTLAEAAAARRAKGQRRPGDRHPGVLPL